MLENKTLKFTFFFFFLDLLLRSESEELSLVSMNSLLLKLSLPPPLSLSLSPPDDFLFVSFFTADFLLSLKKREMKQRIERFSHLNKDDEK